MMSWRSYGRKRSGSIKRGWGGIRFDDPSYSTEVNLGVGYALTLAWSKQEGAFYFAGQKESPRHTCGDKDYRNCPDQERIPTEFFKNKTLLCEYRYQIQQN